MKIQILGMGCASCKALQKRTEKAVKKMGLNVEVEMVDTLEEIMKFGVTSTPALVIDGKVISAGKLWKVPKIIEILEGK